MSKIKLSIIALSCVMALSACSSSSKGGTDNSEQIRQLESDLNQKIAELSKKTEGKGSKSSTESSQGSLSQDSQSQGSQSQDSQSQGSQSQGSLSQDSQSQGSQSQGSQSQGSQSQDSQTQGSQTGNTYTSSSDTETKLKELEKLLADEKSKVSLGDKIFGGTSGEMTDYISGGVLVGDKNDASRPQARDIKELTIVDESGRLKDIPIFKEANAIDPWSGEPLDDDPYNLRKDGQSILSNSNFQASAFGTYFDNLSGNQYFFAQGLPTAIAQIPTTGLVEYKGGVAYQKDGSNSERSEMKATADFTNKVIDINITEKANAVPSMNFGGKITGNSFAGEVNGIKTQGGFFGENAKEMTGLFINEADHARGAFGGIKQ